VLYSLTGSAKRNRAHPFFYLRDVLDRLPVIVHDPRLLPLFKVTCHAAPLTEEQRARLPGCQRPSQYLDILRCHTRSLANAFLHNEMEDDIVAALSELLPDRWIAAHPPSPGDQPLHRHARRLGSRIERRRCLILRPPIFTEFGRHFPGVR
jgi:hypothetical protein